MLHRPVRARRLTRLIWLTVLVAATVLFLSVAGSYAWLYVQESANPRLICLMYHRFVTDEEYRQCHGANRLYSVPVSSFEAQLARLRDMGYTAVTMDDAVAFARGTRELPQPAVLITIDDGCHSALSRAVPLLAKYGLRAILFLTTDSKAYVFDHGEQCRISDDELRRLDPRVVEIGAHGVHHDHLRDLPDTALAAELRDSREKLELVLGRPVRHMAVPGNWYDQRVLEYSAHAGFEGVCVSDPGMLQHGDSPRMIPRITVPGYFDLPAFESALAPTTIVRHRLTRAWLHLPDLLIGKRRWTPIRESISAALPPRLISPFGLFITGGVLCAALYWTTRRRRIPVTIKVASAAPDRVSRR